jgi:hypothetical protein
MPSVLQPWVSALPLRHQASLLTAVRGCDGVPKRDESKTVVRALRATYLVAADPYAYDRPGSFMYVPATLATSLHAFAKGTDQYPIHWVLHLAHAAQIVGYKHPEAPVRQIWRGFYEMLVHAWHLQPESEADLDARLLPSTIDGGEEPPPRRSPKNDIAEAVATAAGEYTAARDPLRAWQSLMPGYRAECIEALRVNCPPKDGVQWALRLIEILGEPPSP